MSERDLAEDRKKFEEWVRTTDLCCVGYPTCDGDLVGLEHDDTCPAKNKPAASFRDCWQAAYQAGLKDAGEAGAQNVPVFGTCEQPLGGSIHEKSSECINWKANSVSESVSRLSR